MSHELVRRHRGDGHATAGPPARRSVADSFGRRVERLLVPQDRRADGSVDERAAHSRYVRMVGVIAVSSIVIFAPSLVVAGVPPGRWPLYIAGAMLAAMSISASLLAMRRGSRLVPLAVVANALLVAGLGMLLGDHYHQIALLYGVIVAGHASIHGFGAALLMVLLGSFLVPFAITAPRGINPTDPVYAFLYLLGIALIIWTRDRLQARGSAVIEASEAKHRDLVERLPAIVYTAEFGKLGAWTYVSPQIEQLLGFPVSAWMEDPGFWWRRLHPDDRRRVLDDETESSAHPPGTPSVIEYRLVDRDGRVHWVRDEAVIVGSSATAPGHWSGLLVDITDRRVLEDRLQHQAFHDPLTGLANRALFADRVGHALARADRRPESLAVLFLDLDDFKTVNDGLGHDAGDELLAAVGEALRGCLRSVDTAARLGGDEFAVLLEDLADHETAVAVAERILAVLARPFQVQGNQIVIAASIGIAEPSAAHETARELLRNADSAMYAAKRLGKGRHETYLPAMHTAAVRRLELTGEIRRALERGEFDMHYQPTVRLDDHSIAGFEALIRWNHPTRGQIPPLEFISVAEETGLIIPIGRFVLDVASRQASAWARLAEPGSPPAMSVNVSGRHFRDASLGPMVGEALAATGLDPSLLILEITESVVMDDSDIVLKRLRELKSLGVRLAIDDFGTGYSSLSYLRRLPVDVLKVDKSFVDGIADSSEAFELARVIVRMGETLGLETVAEGVELPAQVAALRRMGCGFAQGFHFARPMAAKQVEELFTQGARDQRRVG